MADCFETYWSEVDRDLERYEPMPEFEPLAVRSTDLATVYAVRLTSVGPYRIFGYHSVPVGDGPFAGLLETPRYGSVNHVPAYGYGSVTRCSRSCTAVSGWPISLRRHVPGPAHARHRRSSAIHLPRHRG